jgi:hypothetical protein
MPIQIIEYTEALIPAVREFNARLRSGGLDVQFHESCAPHGLSKGAGRKLYEEYFVAVDEGAAVRGSYGLKQQDFWIGGQTVSIADFWLPISEGAVDRAYAAVAVGLLRDARQRQPLLYGLGMGGYKEPLVRLLAASGWRMLTVPFFFRVVHPAAFLRNISYLRRGRAAAAALDAVAASGLGWLAVKTLQRLAAPKASQKASIVVEEVAEFSDWADRLWNDCKQDYGMSAVRDAETLRLLYPQRDPRFIRLKVSKGAQVVGWAVLLDSQLSEHKYFGAMRLGLIADCLARPADARAVAVAAREALKSRGVDLIVSNQSHGAWGKALRTAGFLPGPSNFIFAASPQLTTILKTANVQDADIHLNRGDGDGPENFS